MNFIQQARTHAHTHISDVRGICLTDF